MARKPHRRQGQFSPDDIREKARANLTLAEASGSEDMELEAFMATFHPELQRDRAYMRSLKAATRKP